ncbi:hypothetical protein L3Y34_005729 [Caenorhabditis briggsae]|uniref:Uncharacterized protein n=1 Tax=Caenorhabditis briggsae TaxID=6238 RepID=A0AAE9D7T3_CAEBR|nr:hypothetical protein L3Y34_005729 [Caenorhabditis briggsae]
MFKQLFIFSAFLLVICSSKRTTPLDPKKAVLELVAAGISKKVADVLVQGDNLYYKQLAAAKGDKEMTRKADATYSKFQADIQKVFPKELWEKWIKYLAKHN